MSDAHGDVAGGIDIHISDVLFELRTLELVQQPAQFRGDNESAHRSISLAFWCNRPRHTASHEYRETTNFARRTVLGSNREPLKRTIWFEIFLARRHRAITSG